ncbi:MAG: PEP-CTERM sorting domain-containing protein, partial [Sedimenticola sp.]|nr:PEP-CTERM sorting domain-containing protein [Sedimenticola sp.]
TTQIINPYGYILSNTDVTHGLVTMLGNTSQADPNDVRYTYGWVALPTNGHQGTGNGEHAIIFDYHNYQATYNNTPYSYIYGYGPDYPGDGRHSPTTYASDNLGSFLVRNSAAVPAPAPLILIGLGLVGLARFRKK